jgi:hypothetical protein
MKVLSGSCRVFDPGDGRVSALGNYTAQAIINRANGARQITETAGVYGIERSPAVMSPVAEEAPYVAEGQGIWLRRPRLPVRMIGYPYTSLLGAALPAAILIATWWVEGMRITLVAGIPWLAVLAIVYFLVRRRFSHVTD